MKKFGCIFDLDGVLVDTARFHFKSWERLASQLGFELSPKLEENLRGISRMASLELVLEAGKIECSTSQKREYAKLKNDWYLESLKDCGDEIILKGVVSLLKELKDAGIPISVGSASKNARRVLSACNLDHYFISIVDGNDVINSKPDPEVFINAARNIQLREDQCIVFEDSPKGIDAAIKGGFRIIGVGSDTLLGEAEVCVPSLEKIGVDYLQDFLAK